MDSRDFWKQFSFAYRLDSRNLQGPLISTEAHKLSASNLILAPEWVARLDKLNRVRAVHGTTAIEGNPLSEAEVSYQIETANLGRSAPFLKLSKEQMQIRNAARAQDWVKDRFTPGSPPFRMRDILTMHEMLTRESDEVNNVPGELRSYPVQVGSPDLGGIHFGAPYDTLGVLMEELISLVNSKKLQSEHAVIQALLAHFFLVTIHPFGDGNGRVSRLVEAGILFQRGYNVHGFYGLSNFFYRNADKYRRLLQQARRFPEHVDVTEFVQFGVEGFELELAGINNFIKTKINRVMYRQMLVASRDKRVSPRRRMLNEREYGLLIYLLDYTEPVDPFAEEPSRKINLVELLDSTYSRIAYDKVTSRTVFRELFRLNEMGFIRLSGRGLTASAVEIDFEAVGKYGIS